MAVSQRRKLRPFLLLPDKSLLLLPSKSILPFPEKSLLPFPDNRLLSSPERRLLLIPDKSFDYPIDSEAEYDQQKDKTGQSTELNENCHSSLLGIAFPPLLPFLTWL